MPSVSNIAIGANMAAQVSVVQSSILSVLL